MRVSWLDTPTERVFVIEYPCVTETVVESDESPLTTEDMGTSQPKKSDEGLGMIIVFVSRCSRSRGVGGKWDGEDWTMVPFAGGIVKRLFKGG